VEECVGCWRGVRWDVQIDHQDRVTPSGQTTQGANPRLRDGRWVGFLLDGKQVGAWYPSQPSGLTVSRYHRAANRDEAIIFHYQVGVRCRQKPRWCPCVRNCRGRDQNGQRSKSNHFLFSNSQDEVKVFRNAVQQAQKQGKLKVVGVKVAETQNSSIDEKRYREKSRGRPEGEVCLVTKLIYGASAVETTSDGDRTS